MDYLIKYF